jgi:plasmid maintenance system antidote protein VapI
MSNSTSNGSMTEVLREAIQASEIPLLTLEQETGVPRASIMRFVRGDQSLRLDIADKLAAYFNLHLVRRRTRKES